MKKYWLFKVIISWLLLIQPTSEVDFRSFLLDTFIKYSKVALSSLLVNTFSFALLIISASDVPSIILFSKIDSSLFTLFLADLSGFSEASF